LTDTPTGREFVEKTFVYITTLSRECRKALTSSFEKNKGMSFDMVEPAMRKEIESWFAQRDKNILLKFEKSSRGRPGEIQISYSGANKGAHFKFEVDAIFTLTGQTENSPSYLKSINVNIDKRDFMK
jgi:lysine/ornithine N-monooxygenase